MSQIFVSNVALDSSATIRIDVPTSGNVRIVVDSANVFYANPVRTVFPSGTVNVAGGMSIAGQLNVTDVIVVPTVSVTTVVATNANLTGDMTVTGNVYSGRVANQSVSMGYIPWAYFTGNTTLTWTGLTPAKQIKMKIGGVLPGATGSLLRMYLSSDGGTNYGAAIQLGAASPNGNLMAHEIVISNTAISGAAKSILSHGGGATTATPIGYAQMNTESVITGVINAVKVNSTGVIAFTTTTAGVGGIVIFGEV